MVRVRNPNAFFFFRFLKDEKLIKTKRSAHESQPKKLIIGPECPICDIKFTKGQNRDHVAWHFMDELREIVGSFPSNVECQQCPYKTNKPDNLVKHIALGHSKLDEFLKDEQLVLQKRAKAMKTPKKVSSQLLSLTLANSSYVHSIYLLDFFQVKIGPTCPVCGVADPSREHVARHFSDEMAELILKKTGGDPSKCPDCDYKGDKIKTLGIHYALVHGQLDIILNDNELMEDKRNNHYSKPKKLSIGPKCPICDLQFAKGQNRDHVTWHFMEELKQIVQEFPDPRQCTQCPYQGDTMDKMVKHVALGHSMLDGFLQDDELVHEKRIRAMSKPKKMELGKTCPVCETNDPTREHVARHLSDELLEIVYGFDDQAQCPECAYNNARPKNLAIHIALVHNMLDHFLGNTELMEMKRSQHLNKPQKIQIGQSCPVCDLQFTKGQSRDHVSWHFMEELRDIVNCFPDPQACPDCPYTSDKVDNVVKHIALGHSKLDELLQDENLIKAKREQVKSKPKKVSIGLLCPICGVSFKKNNRDHVAWHFMEELRSFVRSTGTPTACSICYYTSDKLDNLCKHYALGHSKLDELLQDEELIKQKKEMEAKKPKKLSFGKNCPICNKMNIDRDHVARHFMAELMEIVDMLPEKKKCNQCDYTNSKVEYMAKHIALFHCKLDELMTNTDLVEEKKAKAMNTPKKVAMPQACAFCNITIPSRDHMIRHFMDDLMKMVRDNSPSPNSCHMCEFTSDKPENVAKHLGLAHSKMDELLQDEEFMAKKVSEYSGPTAPTASFLPEESNLSLQGKSLPVREAVRKSKRQKEFDEKMAIEAKRAEIKQKRDDDRRRTEILTPAKRAGGGKGSSSSPPKPIVITPEDMTSSLKLPSSISLTRKSDGSGAVCKRPPPLSGASVAGSSTWFGSPAAKKSKWDNNASRGVNLNQISPAADEADDITFNGDMEIDMGMMVPEVSHSIEEEGSQESEYMEMNVDTNLYQGEEEEDDDDEDDTLEEDEVDSELLLEPQIVLNEDHASQQHVQELQIFPSCPVCDGKAADREHVSQHFATELAEVVEGFPDPLTCIQCEFKSNSPGDIAIHIAVSHSQLEKCLQDKILVRTKRQMFKTAKRMICHICEQNISASNSKDHFMWHFIEPLRELVTDKKCPECAYTNEKVDNICRHLALFHHKVEQYLGDQELVDSLRAKYLSKPKKAEIGSNCPICDMASPSREHVARHFNDELMEYISHFPDQLACSECSYKGERTQNLARHYGLVHSLLDELLANKELVANKRSVIMSKPKKYVMGDNCPVCDVPVGKRDSRNHAIWHFMEDLKEMVWAFPDPTTCQICNLVNPR